MYTSEVTSVANQMRPFDKYYAGWIRAMARAKDVTPERMAEVLSDARSRIDEYKTI